jgi:lysine-N-methylase
MGHPVHHLPVLQKWDCHTSGSCCKEYVVDLSPEERQRIIDQKWDVAADLGGLQPFRRVGLWKRRWVLTHRKDGACVFLSEDGRCRIHERHGYESKPLACRLYPFVLVPTGDHWSVSVRFACPSAAASKGREMQEYGPALREFAAELARRAGVPERPDGTLTPPPPLRRRQTVPWPDVHRCVEALLTILLNRRDPMELRMRKCLALAAQMRKVRLDHIEGPRLTELLDLLRGMVDAETPAQHMRVEPPGWIGRVLFRQALAVYTRKDQGPDRGPAQRSRASLLMAAIRFARGRGAVPRTHRALPETTFEQVEVPRGALGTEAEEVLERYYHIKVGSLQFCGSTSFGLPLWEGFESLAVTLPVILWVARAFAVGEKPGADAIMKALTIVDYQVGFNRVLARLRQRLSFRILARTGELGRLIAWYSR